VEGVIHGHLGRHLTELSDVARNRLFSSRTEGDANTHIPLSNSSSSVYVWGTMPHDARVCRSGGGPEKRYRSQTQKKRQIVTHVD
jgi:hypothetical protein